jgi:hypothetical protein
MPSTSKAQYRFMQAVSHNPDFAKAAGVPQSVGKDFASADKGQRYKSLPERKEGSVAKKKGWLKKDKGEKKLAAKLTSKEKKTEDQRMKSRYGDR